jgi:hypothetical protein
MVPPVEGHADHTARRGKHFPAPGSHVYSENGVLAPVRIEDGITSAG